MDVTDGVSFWLAVTVALTVTVSICSPPSARVHIQRMTVPDRSPPSARVHIQRREGYFGLRQYVRTPNNLRRVAHNHSRPTFCEQRECERVGLRNRCP
jgi:hypothetical protein